MKSRNIIDSLLLEMPRYIVGNPGKPKVDFYAEVDFSKKIFRCTTTAFLSGGESRSFEASMPMSSEQVAFVTSLNRGMSSLGNPVLSDAIKVKFAEELETVKMKAIARAKAWVKSVDNPPIGMVGVETFNVETEDALPIVNDFRYVSSSDSTSQRIYRSMADQLASFSSYIKPGDKVVKVEGGGHDYYVLADPEEYAELRRRIIKVNRGKISSAMRAGHAT